jgi:hypothetical protein
VSLPAWIADGLRGLLWIDPLVMLVLLAVIVGGCFLALRPCGQALHDRIAGTGVFRVEDVRGQRAFAPLLRGVVDVDLAVRSDDATSTSDTAPDGRAVPTPAESARHDRFS